MADLSEFLSIAFSGSKALICIALKSVASKHELVEIVATDMLKDETGLVFSEQPAEVRALWISRARSATNALITLAS